jgi:SOS response regulatory protein OraA/RecX
MREKGIDDSIAEKILSEQEVNPLEAALKLAQKKKIGIYNPDINQRKERRNKDLGILIRAGFDYDIALKVLESDDADF